MRITLRLFGNRAEDLRHADEIRRVLWPHAPVAVDAENPLRGIHRDVERRAYFEFATTSPEEIQRVLQEQGFWDRVELTESQEAIGEECQNCGNVAGPVLPTVCPNCLFRDISPCPSCGQEIPRKKYLALGSDLYRCPHCHTRVGMRFNDPMFLPNGDYNQPLVVVYEREFVEHELR